MNRIDSLLKLQEAVAPRQWRATSDAAQVVANYLVCHPCVAEVRYPGLKQDPDFARAATTLRGGFGPRLSFRLKDENGWRRFEATSCDPMAQVLALERILAAT